jgi:diadenosine tetraphosphate (Ap4A) HIT family hydrolase
MLYTSLVKEFYRMQNGSRASLDAEPTKTNCAFCQYSSIAPYILKETPTFRIIADHAPLVEGHLLIIPRHHYACYGTVPANLDEELLALKHEVQNFLAQFYAPAIFWEHGIFRQTVFHAHLHCFPFGETTYDLSRELHHAEIHSQHDIRTWYASYGEYFFLQDSHHALLFQPNLDIYTRIIHEVLWSRALALGGHSAWRSPQQRREEGVALIEAMKAKWQLFQQQGVQHADEAGTR